MKKITITFPDKTAIEVENGIKPLTLINHFEQTDKKILAVMVNNEVCSLDETVDISATLKPVYADSSDGAAIYRRSLCFVLATAAHNIYPKARLLVGHSLGYGYYYTLDTGKTLTAAEITALKKEMERIIKADEPIENGYLSYKDACDLFESLGLVETRKQLNYHCAPRISVNSLESFTDLYYEPLVASTGVLNVF